MVASQIDVAGWNFEVPVNEVHQPVRQISGKIRSVIGGPVFAQPPSDIYARIALRRELDVRIGLIVAQQNVIARLPLLDEIVLERERFLLIIDLDKGDLARFRDQRPGLRIGEAFVGEITADAVPQILGFAYVYDRAVGVFIKIDPG